MSAGRYTWLFDTVFATDAACVETRQLSREMPLRLFGSRNIGDQVNCNKEVEGCLFSYEKFDWDRYVVQTYAEGSEARELLDLLEESTRLQFVIGCMPFCDGALFSADVTFLDGGPTALSRGAGCRTYGFRFEEPVPVPARQAFWPQVSFAGIEHVQERVNNFVGRRSFRVWVGGSTVYEEGLC